MLEFRPVYFIRYGKMKRIDRLFLNFIKSLPEQDIKGYSDFQKNGRGEVYLELVENLEIKNEVSLPDYFQMVLCVSWLLPPLCCQFRRVRLL